MDMFCSGGAILSVYHFYNAGEEKEEDEADEEEKEEEEEDQEDSEGVAVTFPSLDLTNGSSDRVERSSSKLWRVRSNGGANGLLGPLNLNLSPAIDIRPTHLSGAGSTPDTPET